MSRGKTSLLGIGWVRLLKVKYMNLGVSLRRGYFTLKVSWLWHYRPLRNIHECLRRISLLNRRGHRHRVQSVEVRVQNADVSEGFIWKAEVLRLPHAIGLWLCALPNYRIYVWGFFNVQIDISWYLWFAKKSQVVSFQDLLLAEVLVKVGLAESLIGLK